MTRAATFALLFSVGCASLIDVKELSPPPPDAADGGTGQPPGACLPDEVTNLVVTPRGVHTAVDDRDVYFTRLDPPDDSAILRCSKCGCEQPTVVVSKLAQPGALAVDDRYVYWTEAVEAGSVNRVAKDDPSDRLRIADQESPIGIAVDEAHVYWTVIGGGPKGVETAGVYRANKEDFAAVTRLARSETLPDDIVPYAIAVDDRHVYYTTAPDLNDQNALEPCNGAFGTVRRVSKTGGFQRSEKVAEGQACPMALALSEDAVHWANLGVGTGLAGSIARKPKAGGSEAVLASSQGRPTSLAFHAGRLAWNAPAAQRVLTCAMPACEEVVSLARDQANPAGISADETGIYWAVLGTVAENFGDGAVRRAEGRPVALRSRATARLDCHALGRPLQRSRSRVKISTRKSIVARTRATRTRSACVTSRISREPMMWGVSRTSPGASATEKQGRGARPKPAATAFCTASRLLPRRTTLASRACARSQSAPAASDRLSSKPMTSWPRRSSGACSGPLRARYASDA